MEQPEQLNSSEDPLLRFFNEHAGKLRARYESLRNAARENPSVAGARGEKLWKQLLENLFPPGSVIAERGKLIFPSGVSSLEFDLFQLRPEYPNFLAHEGDPYLANGVTLVLECKNTLEKHHVEEAFARCAKLKRQFFSEFEGSLGFDVTKGKMITPLMVGLVAHHHTWKSDDKEVLARLTDLLWNQLNSLESPLLAPDFVCISSLAFWGLAIGIRKETTNSNKDVVEARSLYSRAILIEKTKTLPDPLHALGYYLMLRKAEVDQEFFWIREYLKKLASIGGGGKTVRWRVPDHEMQLFTEFLAKSVPRSTQFILGSLS